MKRQLHLLLKRFDTIWFGFRLWCYSVRYGGYDRIPPKLIGDLIGPLSDDDFKVIKFGAKLNYLTELIDLEQSESTLCLRYAELANGIRTDDVICQYVRKLVKDAQLGKDIMDGLEHLGDTTLVSARYRAVLNGVEREFESFLRSPIR